MTEDIFNPRADQPVVAGARHRRDARVDWSRVSGQRDQRAAAHLAAAGAHGRVERSKARTIPCHMGVVWFQSRYCSDDNISRDRDYISSVEAVAMASHHRRCPSSISCSPRPAQGRGGRQARQSITFTLWG